LREVEVRSNSLILFQDCLLYKISSNRPRILLIPNSPGWIIARMCEQIRTALSGEFEFFTVSEGVFEMRPQLWRPLLAEMDLVHCMNESSGEVLEAAGGASIPVLTWIHHITEWSVAHAASCRISSGIVACTGGWSDRIGEHTRVPIHVVRHGVDSSRFAPVPNARARFGVPNSDFVIGFFGSRGSDRDNNRKGMDTFLEAVVLAAKRIRNLRVLLLGPGWDPEFFQRAGIAITYPGLIPESELPTAFSALDVYLMTARVEGGPCTVLESMACGTPVVATRVGLVPEVVRDGENGFSVPVGDAAAMADALVQLARDRLLYERVAEQARATAGTLPWKTVLEPLGALYRQVCGSKTRVEHPRIHGQEFSRRALVVNDLFELRREIRNAAGPQAPLVALNGMRGLLRTAGDLPTFGRAIRMAVRSEI
jgi:glycosyltransferase involved in cell wall biosynthesis